MATDGRLNISATLDISQVTESVKQYERDMLRAQTSAEKAGKVIGESLLSGTEDLTQNIKIQRDIIKGLEDQYKQAAKAVEKAAPGAAKVKLQAELSAVRKVLDSEKESMTQLVDAQERYKQGATALRTQLMSIRNTMGQLALQGKENTDEYRKQEAEMQRLGTVYRKLQAEQKALTTGGTQWAGIISGIQGVAGAFAAGQGAVSMFVTDNEKLAQIQTKLQAILAVTIGLQQVSNTLHETSEFRITTVKKATELWSKANTKLATALGISNASAKVLMGTLTLGLSVAIGAVMVALDKWRKKQEELSAMNKIFAQNLLNYNLALHKERNEIDANFEALKKAKEGTQSYYDARKMILDSYGKFLKGYSTEISTLQDVEGAYRAVGQAAIESAQQRAKAAFTQQAQERESEKMGNALGKLTERIRQYTPEKTLIQYPDQVNEVVASISKVLTQTGKTLREKTIDIGAILEDYALPADRIMKNIGTVFGVIPTWSEDLIREFDTAFKSFEGVEEIANNVWQSLTPPEQTVIQNKSFWEQQQNEALSALNAMTEAKKGTKEWNAAYAKLTEANEHLKIWDFSNKDALKSQSDLYSQLLANQLKLQEDRIKLMRDGKNKELAEAKLAFDKEMAQIEQEQIKREAAYKKAGKSMPEKEQQTFNLRREATKDQYSQSTLGIELRYAQQLADTYRQLGDVFVSEEARKTRAVEQRYQKMRDKALEDLQAGSISGSDFVLLNTQIDNAEAYEQMQDLVDAFGTTQDKITKIQKTAQEARDKAIKNNRQDLLPQIDRQEQEEISKIELDELMKSDDWINLFQNLDVLSQKKIHEIIDRINGQLKNAKLNPIDFKTAVDQLDKAEDTARSKNPFTALARGIPKLKSALATAKKAWADYEKAKGTPDEAKARIAAEQAQIEADKTRLETWQDAQKGAADLSKTMGAVGDMLGKFGVQVPQEMEGVMGALDAFASMDLTRPFSIVTGAIQGVASLIGGIFGNKSFLIPQEVFDQYDTFIDVLDKVIDREKELIETVTGAQAVMASDEALKAIERQEDATRRLAKAYLASREKGKKSYGVRTERELRGYKDEIEAAGFNWKKLYGTGRMEGLFDMSAEEIKDFQKKLPEVWAHLDEKTREYLETIVECGEKTEEVQAALKEAATGISFDGLKSDLLDFLNDMESTFDDVAGNFEDTMMNAINRVIATGMDGRLQEWYDEFSKAMEDDVLSEAERENLKRKYENIYADALRDREQMYSIAGISPGSNIEQQASSKGFQTMSQDTGDELNGRFTAMQGYMSQINDKMTDIGMKMTTVGDVLKSQDLKLLTIQNSGFEIQGLIATSINYFKTMDKNLALLPSVADSLNKIAKNTAKL